MAQVDEDKLYWPGAADDIQTFNKLYATVQKKPTDLPTLRKALAETSKLNALGLWRMKCLAGEPQTSLLDAARLVTKLSRDKVAEPKLMLDAIETFKTAAQRAVASTAPETFTYQGFKVSNPQRFAETLSLKALEGLDFLKALFKKRGVSPVLDQGITRIVLAHNADAEAYFHAGTREMVLSVPELNKGNPARIIQGERGHETILHEFGHYVHRNFITGEAREAWNAPWQGVPSLANPNAPQWSEDKRREVLDPLEIPTDYGKTDEFEDFAETFVAFMAAPERLSPPAKFRMQRALALSRLYGKPVTRLAFNVMVRYLRDHA